MGTGSRLGGLVSLTGSTPPIDGLAAPVQLGAGLSYTVGIGRSLGLSVGIGLTDSAPDFTVASTWRLTF